MMQIAYIGCKGLPIFKINSLGQLKIIALTHLDSTVCESEKKCTCCVVNKINCGFARIVVFIVGCS